MAETFPSKAALLKLVERMNADQSRYVRLGIVDCRVGLRDEDQNKEYTLVFDTYGCTGVEEGTTAADFVLEAGTDVWQAMYDDIAAHGKATLAQTLNHLALPGISMRVVSDDQLAEDLFYRYNQTFQSFFDAAGEAELAGSGAVR